MTECEDRNISSGVLHMRFRLYVSFTFNLAILTSVATTLGLRTVRITVTAVQFTVYTGQLSNFDGTVRDYGTGIRPYLRVNYHSLRISLPKS